MIPIARFRDNFPRPASGESPVGSGSDTEPADVAEDVDDAAERQPGAERDFEVPAAPFDDHEGNADDRADERSHENGGRHRLPAEDRPRHGHQLDVSAPETHPFR